METPNDKIKVTELIEIEKDEQEILAAQAEGITRLLEFAKTHSITLPEGMTGEQFMEELYSDD